MIERLENRRLFAVTTGFAGGVLTVTGDAEANNVSIVRGGTENSQLLVRVGDATIRSIAYAEVNSITVNLLGGNDTLRTGENVAKPMNVSGGEGNDNLTTGAGNDTVHGNQGNDTITSLPGNDNLFGDDGADTMNGGLGGDSFTGGGGFDTVTYASRTVGVRVTLDNVANDGQPASTDRPAENDNVRTDIEHVVGGSGNDFISAAPVVTSTGTIRPGPVTLDGGGGNDGLVGSSGGETGTTAIISILNGGDGNDELAGGSKNDQLNGGGGNDVMRGNAGNDRLNGGNGADNMFGGEGVDNVTYADRLAGVNVSVDNVANDGTAATATAAGEGDNAHSDIENITGGRGNDRLIGSDAVNVIGGGEGNDYIEGRGGADTIEGSAGNDEIHGGEGNDNIYGGTGADSLFGEGGNDFIRARDGIADTVSGGDGNEDRAQVDVGLDIVTGIEINVA